MVWRAPQTKTERRAFLFANEDIDFGAMDALKAIGNASCRMGWVWTPVMPKAIGERLRGKLRIGSNANEENY